MSSRPAATPRTLTARNHAGPLTAYGPNGASVSAGLYVFARQEAQRIERSKGQQRTMALKIEEIEGIGPVYGQKLTAAGVNTDADMLERAGSVKGRAELAAQTGISETLILKWANYVDLARIDGVGPQFAELLEAAGVDTVKELAQRNAANLAAKLAEVNAQKNLAGRSPSESQVADWIAQAKTMERRIFY
jgi:predicted flap endonuclease-1-like 5' DNA nuclease